MKFKYAIGIDGGSTKTHAAIVDSDFNIITELTYNRPAHYKQIGGIKNLAKLIISLCDEIIAQKSNIKPEDINFVCLGATGMGTEQEQLELTNEIKKRGFKFPFVVTNDAIIALLGGTDKDYGILVISGTGSIAIGIDENGKIERIGGWGALLGDEGSGYIIGLKGLRYLAKSLDGRLEKTKLKDFIFEELNIKDVFELRNWSLEVGFQKSKIAALAPAVFKAYRAGDKLAAKIIENEASEIALAVNTLIKKLKFENKEVEIVAAGSNLIHNGDYFNLVSDKIKEKYPKANLILPKQSACVGAVRYGMRFLNKK